MIRLSENAAALTFDAEQLSNHPNKWEALGMLIYLLEHESSLVREGAVYGLAGLGNMPGVKESLLRHSTEEIEKSLGVRLSAKEALEDL